MQTGKLAYFFYNLLILPLLSLALRFAGLFHEKIRMGIRGRQNVLERLQQQLAAFPAERKRILVHAASMGEYEQARPVIRQLKEKFPDHILILSVFSPSAFENLHTTDADILTYLPFDHLQAVRRFLDLVRPRFLLFTRYDVWPNLVREASRRGTFTLLFAASLHEKSARRKWLIRQFNRAVHAHLDAICPISSQAAQAMNIFLSDHHKIAVCGDPRFDQVVFRARERALAELLPKSLLKNEQIFVAGSCWPEDEVVLLPAFAELKQGAEKALLLLAPHEPTAEYLDSAQRSCCNLKLRVVMLSEFESETEADVVVVDRVGILANIYGAGIGAFVGGGFGPGVHSVIEAAAHGLPVLFGPRMRNSAEAIDMVESGCGFIVENEADCLKYLFDIYHKEDFRRLAGEKSREFVATRTGAAEKIVALLPE